MKECELVNRGMMEFAYGPMFLVKAAQVEIVFVDAKHGPAGRPKSNKLSLARLCCSSCHPCRDNRNHYDHLLSLSKQRLQEIIYFPLPRNPRIWFAVPLISPIAKFSPFHDILSQHYNMMIGQCI